MVDLDKAKQRLLDLKQEYQTRVDKIQHDMQNPDTDMTQDWDDQAVINEQNDVRKNLLVKAQQNLELVNNALLRIENGTYGICTVSGEEIEPERLEAVPFATTCMKHAK
ncbi:MAG TPA: conjugal transfer protein TraR [Moraxella sp.]|uniref:TraR/DksA family transcriptional regulator n=1 Tax=Faucicola osloensis TaxID=34062 RepID=UPI0009755EB2|nr:TraR/DksA C4-type zinc finger protein [Moraxella osloensis]ONG37581.1 conjugal transfer protein TraR [Enhydrobacter sp. H5]HCC66044.1 conjugal transfer protein TraR [Moraxella sp.]ATQ85191.1 conjugal transfer protein TraR [Moraxella osloensis]MCK6051401.1 TraR/DksA C4-type zinc finger protein [Moraxella osloensis]PAL17583.1 conjugal transfer protein TraR [Moraxella osloensis]